MWAPEPATRKWHEQRNARVGPVVVQREELLPRRQAEQRNLPSQ